MEDIGKRVQLKIAHRALLALQQGKSGDAHLDTSQLQLRQKLDLLHAELEPGLCDPCADQIPCSERELSCAHFHDLHFHKNYMKRKS